MNYDQSWNKITKLHEKFGCQITKDKMTKQDLLVYLHRCATGDSDFLKINGTSRVLEDITSLICGYFRLRDEEDRLREENKNLHKTVDLLLGKLKKAK